MYGTPQGHCDIVMHLPGETSLPGYKAELGAETDSDVVMAIVMGQ